MAGGKTNAWVCIGLREVDAAFEWLERAVDARDQLMMPLKSYAFFDPLRADPRFKGSPAQDEAGRVTGAAG